MNCSKVCVITGATGDIGFAICHAFAKEGYDIAAIYGSNTAKAKTLEKDILDMGVSCITYQTKIESYSETESVFKQILCDFGKIDVLVNNAGITRDKLVLSMGEKDFTDVIDINLKGAFNCIKWVYPVMAKQRSGRIISISSVSGQIGNTGQANYSASKSGLFGLTKSVARELAPRGICVNAICPGFIEGTMTNSLNTEEITKKIPMKRMGKPEEVAYLTCFLASDSAAYITGEIIRVDGGIAM